MNKNKKNRHLKELRSKGSCFVERHTPIAEQNTVLCVSNSFLMITFFYTKFNYGVFYG